MKYLILVGDGMGDLPLTELGGKTPLEAASTPMMDQLARCGELFTVATVPSGMAPGSDVANLSLLGYNPKKIYSGRAPLEAASMGVPLADGEIAFRCNFVTLKHGSNNSVQMVDYSAGHISTDEAAHLIKDLAACVDNSLFRFYPGVSYRHLMVFTGDSSWLHTVPPHDYTGQDVTSFYQRYRGNESFGRLLVDAEKLLSDHPVNQARKAAGKEPANGIWLWGEGKTPTMTTLQEEYGVSGALISAVDLLKGIGVKAGLEIINVPGATGYLDTNYQGKVDAALAAIRDKDLVFVHVEAPDEASHQGLLAEKIQAIEDFDSRIVGPIIAGLQSMAEEYRVIIAMDHYTPLSTRTHDPRPVPIVLYDSLSTLCDDDLVYTEKCAVTCGDFLASGREMIDLLLER